MAYKKRIYEKVRSIHRVNRLLWLAILSGMLTFAVVVIVLSLTHLIVPASSGPDRLMENIFFLIAIALLLIIFYVKRTYLIPDKIISRAGVKTIHITATDDLDLIEQFGPNAGLLVKSMMIMRRYFMVIWSANNLLVLMGFIYYLFNGTLRTFLIYLIIALYSMIVNFPSFKLIKVCYESIFKKPLEMNG